MGATPGVAHEFDRETGMRLRIVADCRQRVVIGVVGVVGVVTGVVGVVTGVVGVVTGVVGVVGVVTGVVGVLSGVEGVVTGEVVGAGILQPFSKIAIPSASQFREYVCPWNMNGGIMSPHFPSDPVAGKIGPVCSR